MADTKKLAESLQVDEVSITHGHKGVMVSVRIGPTWMAKTLDNEDLKKSHHASHTVAQALTEVADALNARTPRRLRNAHDVMRDQFENLDDTFAKAFPIPLRDSSPPRVYRAEVEQSSPPPAPEPAAPSSPAALANRFEAVVAELER